MKKIIFILISALTIIASLVESYFYSGFFYKHFFINIDILIVVTLILFWWPVESKYVKTNILYNSYIFVISNIYLPLIFVYAYFTYINAINFPNFIFSKYHIQPSLLIKPIVLSLAISLSIYIENKKRLFLKNKRSNILKNNKITLFFFSLLFVIIFSFGVNNALKSYSVLVGNFTLAFSGKNLSWEDKSSRIFGLKYGYYYDYVNFVKEVTSKSSSILLPPQQNPWQYEGNQRLTRFFLYPRILYSAHEKIYPKPDYIVLAWGSEDFPPKDINLYGWPKEKIDAEEVYIYDINTKEYKIYKGNYDPAIYLKKGVYGLIKTK